MWYMAFTFINVPFHHTNTKYTDNCSSDIACSRNDVLIYRRTILLMYQLACIFWGNVMDKVDM